MSQSLEEVLENTQLDDETKEKIKKKKREVIESLPDNPRKNELVGKISLIDVVMQPDSDLEHLRRKKTAFSPALEVFAYLDKVGAPRHIDDISRALAVAKAKNLGPAWIWCVSRIRELIIDVQEDLRLLRLVNLGRQREITDGVHYGEPGEIYDEVLEKIRKRDDLIAAILTRTSMVLATSPHYQGIIVRSEDKLSDTKVTVAIGPQKGGFNPDLDRTLSGGNE